MKELPKEGILKRGKTRLEFITRTTDRWDGPLGNSIRKRKEERKRRWLMERQKKQIIMQEMDNKLSEKMHGFWYGPVDKFQFEAASVNCFPRLVGANRFFKSATFHLHLTKVVLQDQINTLASSLCLTVQNIRNQGGLLAFREPRSFVQLGCGSMSGALGAKYVYPLQGITTRMHAQKFNADVIYSGMSNVFMRTLQHEGLRGFRKGLVPNLLNFVLSVTKLKAAI